MGLPFARGGWCEGIRGGVSSSVSRGRPSGYALRVRSPRKALASAPLFPIPRSCASRPRGGSDCVCGWRSPAVSRLPMRSRARSYRAAERRAEPLCCSVARGCTKMMRLAPGAACARHCTCASALLRILDNAAAPHPPAGPCRRYVGTCRAMRGHRPAPLVSQRGEHGVPPVKLTFGHETVMMWSER